MSSKSKRRPLQHCDAFHLKMLRVAPVSSRVKMRMKGQSLHGHTEDPVKNAHAVLANDITPQIVVVRIKYNDAVIQTSSPFLHTAFCESQQLLLVCEYHISCFINNFLSLGEVSSHYHSLTRSRTCLKLLKLGFARAKN